MINSRRQFLKSAAVALGAAGAVPARLTAAFDPLEKNIRELQRAMAAGQLTSAQLVQFYLDRIAAYDLPRAPGGSSGGSAVAATANFAAATLGTDTSGSIRIPSSHNNASGLRPSFGLSSRAGIIPFGHTQDTGGPIARSVEDVAIVLDATV